MPDAGVVYHLLVGVDCSKVVVVVVSCCWLMVRLFMSSFFPNGLSYLFLKQDVIGCHAIHSKLVSTLSLQELIELCLFHVWFNGC